MLNILFIFVHRASFSFSSNDNYSLPSSDWILDNTSPLFNVKSVLTSDQIIYDTPSLFQSTESLDNNFSNVWTEKERTLLERGLVRLSLFFTMNCRIFKSWLIKKDGGPKISSYEIH